MPNQRMHDIRRHELAACPKIVGVVVLGVGVVPSKFIASDHDLVSPASQSHRWSSAFYSSTVEHCSSHTSTLVSEDRSCIPSSKTIANPFVLFIILSITKSPSGSEAQIFFFSVVGVLICWTLCGHLSFLFQLLLPPNACIAAGKHSLRVLGGSKHSIIQ